MSVLWLIGPKQASSWVRVQELDKKCQHEGGIKQSERSKIIKRRFNKNFVARWLNHGALYLEGDEGC